MSINDARFKALRDQGFTGHVNDMLLAYYKAGGATSDNINDAQYEFLLTRDVKPGQINDMLFEALRAAGITKTYWPLHLAH